MGSAGMVGVAVGRAAGAVIAVIVGVWAGALVYYDLRSKRLPNWLTVPAALVSLAWWHPAGLAWPALYALGGRGVGGGDVKLAVPLGMVAAQAGGWWGVLAAIAAASVFTVLWGACSRDRAPAHGPSMLIATGLVAVCAHWWE